MHPRDLHNQALVAAGNAQREGFTATAEAFKLMAMICAEEARELLYSETNEERNELLSSINRLHLLQATH